VIRVATWLVTVGLMLVLGASDSFSGSASNAAARIARTETDLCLALCPPIPADASSDWLRSEEGQKVNACPMRCRVEQPAAALYRTVSELGAGRRPATESRLVERSARESPELMRRFLLATKDLEGRRLGSLCAKARASITPSDESSYIECTGRTVLAEAPEVLRPPDPARALHCATLFAEREHSWLTRCPAIEAQVNIEACVERIEQLALARQRQAVGARERCLREALERLTVEFRRRAKS
jgi:hypothetical protein